MRERAISSRFPFADIVLTFVNRPGRPLFETLAFIDTGFDGDIILPGSYVNELGEPDASTDWQLADGSVVRTPAYRAFLSLLGITSSFSVMVSVLGDRAMVGRSV